MPLNVSPLLTPRLAIPLVAPLAALALTGLLASGCAQLERQKPQEASAQTMQDDDAYCRDQAGPPGSAPYAECLKIRDQKRGAAENRIERTHRNLSERMLNGQ